MFVSVLALLPTNSLAQGVDVGIIGEVLQAIQPPADTFSGPYVSGDLGKYSQGFGVGLNAIWPSGLVAGAEFTLARFEGTVSGRQINGFGPNEGRARAGRMDDSLLVGLIGYAKTTGRARVLFLGGGGLALNSMTIDDQPWGPDAPRPLVTGGLDVLFTLGTRAAFIAGGRYAMVFRGGNLLMGPHVIRIGAGIRVRIH